MTEQEAIDALREKCSTGDPEMDHVNADDLLIDFIRAQGFEELADEFERRADGFWYA